MISYMMIGTDNFAEAVNFYDVLMEEMGASKAYSTDKNVGWGWGAGTPMFIVTKPFDEKSASTGNGSMIAFNAESVEKVDTLHATVLALGGTSEGAPGLRGEHMYVGYCRDLDGNKFNFIHYLAAATE